MDNFNLKQYLTESKLIKEETDNGLVNEEGNGLGDAVYDALMSIPAFSQLGMDQQGEIAASVEQMINGASFGDDEEDEEEIDTDVYLDEQKKIEEEFDNSEIEENLPFKSDFRRREMNAGVEDGEDGDYDDPEYDYWINKNKNQFGK